jgi:hypothetical protein
VQFGVGSASLTKDVLEWRGYLFVGEAPKELAQLRPSLSIPLGELTNREPRIGREKASAPAFGAERVVRFPYDTMFDIHAKAVVGEAPTIKFRIGDSLFLDLSFIAG